MKNFTLLFILFCLSTVVFAQNNSSSNFQNSDIVYQSQELPSSKDINETIWIQDSIYNYDDTGNGLEITWRNKTLVYNENGKMTNAISHFWDETNDTWTKKDTSTVTHHSAELFDELVVRPWNTVTEEWDDTLHYEKVNENETLGIYLYKNWDYSTNEFLYGQKTIYIYDTEGIITNVFYYTWDSDIDTWLNLRKESYFYNNGKVTQKLKETWNDLNSSWDNMEKHTYTYDENGYLSEEILEQWDFIDSWHNSTFFLYTYNLTNLSQKITQYWNSGTSIWENNRLDLNTYDTNGNKIKDVAQDWDSGTSTWINSYQNIYYYENNVFAGYTHQRWEFDAWINYSQRIYILNSEGDRIQYDRQVWNIDTETWDITTQRFYYLSEYETTNVLFSNHNIKVYPNPASNILKIIGINNIFRIKIYSVSGKLVKEDSTIKNEVDIRKLKNGVYFININSSDGKYIKKFIKH